MPYFHVVFTLPAELRRLVRSHQRQLIVVLFRAAFQSLRALCADPKWLGGRVGALAVLHTWTRTLEWHPHLHLLVPAGALAPDGRTWLTPPAYRNQFLVPVRALGKHFRGRFLHLARRALPGTRLPHIPWGKRWVVFAKPVAQPHHVLDYLGRYVHRTALSDKAITACNDNSVSFTYRDSRTQRRQSMTLPPHEFLRRFLQHVPLKLKDARIKRVLLRAAEPASGAFDWWVASWGLHGGLLQAKHQGKPWKCRKSMRFADNSCAIPATVPICGYFPNSSFTRHLHPCAHEW